MMKNFTFLFLKTISSTSLMFSLIFCLSNVAFSQTYELVTTTGQLQVGDEYLIAGFRSNNNTIWVMSDQTANNRSAVQAASGGSMPSEIEASLNYAVFELGQSNGNWTFYDIEELGYLYAASSGSNWLRTRELNSDGNSEWVITINNSEATVTAQGNFTRNLMRFNATNNPNLFSCYASGQTPVYLYRLVSTESNLNATPNILTNLGYVVGSTFSQPQSFELTGSNLNGGDITATLSDINERFEISLDEESGYSDEIVITDYDGSALTIYARLKVGEALGDYIAFIDFADDAAQGFELAVELNASVIAPPPPTLETSVMSLTGFNYEFDNGGPSVAQTFELSGVSMDGSDVELVVVNDFYEISPNGVTYVTELTLPAFDGMETTIYVRLIEDQAVGTYNDVILISGGGFADVLEIDLSGEVEPTLFFQNDIEGTNPNTFDPYINGQIVNPNIMVSGIGRGPGIVGTNANDRYNANAWNSASLDADKYFYFTITPNVNFEIDFISFQYTGQASGTGPNNFAFRSSVDNFTANIGSPNASGTTIDLSSFEGIDEEITFRLYGWGASGSGGTFSINDFVFSASVIEADLPIDLLSFNATPKNGKVVLDWTYENAIDFERFVVEHSAGDRSWAEIASVDLLAETISSRSNALNAVHDAPVKGANYYRLKMVDLDGTYKYSRVEAVNMDKTGTVRVVNNFVEDRVQLRNEGGFDDITVRITDMQGRQVSEQVLRNMSGTNDISVDVDGVQGMFIMTVEAGGSVEAFRMMRK